LSRRWTFVLLGAAACSGDAPFAPSTPPLPSQDAEATEATVASYGEVHGWSIILGDAAGRVWIAQTDAGAPTVTSSGRTWTATLWARLDSAPVARDLTLRMGVFVHSDQAGSAGRVVALLRWVLADRGVVLASGDQGGALRQDPRHGVLRARGRASGLSGGRLTFEAISDTPMPTAPVDDGPPAPRVVVRTPAVVSLRIDDCMAADAAAFHMMHALGLVAEMAIPSRRLDRPGHCTQGLLQAMVADGNTVESHSRWHVSAPPSFGDFYLETVGAALDLRGRGFDPHVFIQPGTWRHGPTLFDGAVKLRSPYFELLRRVYVATEAYAWPAAMRLPVTGRQGPDHWPLKVFTPVALATKLRQAAADSTWITFMWHMWDMPLPELEARLRVIAALRDSGLVTVLPYYPALRAVRH